MLYSPQQLNVYTVFLIQTSVSSRTSAVAYQIGIIADIVEFVNKLLLLFLAGIVQNYLQFFLVFQIFLLIYFWSYINVYKRNDRRRHCFPDQQFDQNSSRLLRHLAFNISSQRKRGLASTPLFILPGNFVIFYYMPFPSNSFFPAFPKEFSHFLQTIGSHS